MANFNQYLSNLTEHYDMPKVSKVRKQECVRHPTAKDEPVHLSHKIIEYIKFCGNFGTTYKGCHWSLWLGKCRFQCCQFSPKRAASRRFHHFT